MARVKPALKSTVVAETVPQERPPEPVKLVPGAMFGYCPKCSAPVEMREITSGGPPWGKDRCQGKHMFPSMQALPAPLVKPDTSYKAKVIPKRGRNKK